MNATEIVLFVGLAAAMIFTQVGTRAMSLHRFLLPFGITGFVAYQYLHSIPTAGGDLGFELILTLAGIAFGALAAAFIRVERDSRSGKIVTRAGVAYATIWIAVFGGRLAFAWLATNSWSRQVGQFAYQHQITSADAWTASFVLMALAMIAARTVIVAGRAILIQRQIARETAPVTGTQQYGI